MFLPTVFYWVFMRMTGVGQRSERAPKVTQTGGTCQSLRVEQEYQEKPSELWATHEYKMVTG